MDYVTDNALPVTVTGIERLPAPTAQSAGATIRYRVSLQSTRAPALKTERIVEYAPDSGDLTLVR